MTYTWSPGRNTEALTNCVGDFIELHFQDGMPAEYGDNGTTNEEIIQLLIERIKSLNEMQGGKFACRENALAITKLEEALHWLHHRSADRRRRGVEGTYTP